MTLPFMIVISSQGVHRPAGSLQLMTSCIQLCNANLEQMKQVSQRLDLLRDRPPSPSAVTSADWKRRSQLLQKKYGGTTSPLSSSSSFGLIQTSSVLLNGERSLLVANDQSSPSCSADTGSNSGSVAAHDVPLAAVKTASSKSSGTTGQQTASSCTLTIISKTSGATKSCDTRNITPGFSAPPRLIPKRSSSSSLSSNTAVRSTGSVSPIPDSASKATSKTMHGPSSSRLDGPPVATVQGSRARIACSTSLNNARPQPGRAPSPARTVSGTRLAAARPTPMRSASPTVSDATGCAASPSGAKLDSTLKTGPPTERKPGTVPRSRTPSNSSVSAIRQPAGPGRSSNLAADRQSRTSTSPVPRTTGPRAQVGKVSEPSKVSQPSGSSKASTIPAGGTPNITALRLSVQAISRPAADTPRVPVVTERPRTSSGAARIPSTASAQSGSGDQHLRTARVLSSQVKPSTVAERTRTKSGPQLASGLVNDNNISRASVAAAQVSPAPSTTASTLRTPSSGVRPRSVTEVSSAKNRDPARLASHRARQTSASSYVVGASSTVNGSSRSTGKAAVGNVDAKVRSVQPPPPPPQTRFTATPAGESTGPQPTSELRASAVPVAGKATHSVTSTSASRPSALQGTNGRPILLPKFKFDPDTTARRRPDDAAARMNTRRASRPYHQVRSKFEITVSTSPRPDASRTALASTAAQARRARLVDKFDMAEVKACLFGRTVSTGPPRPYTAALRLWLRLLPGVNALFKVQGLTVVADLEAKPQVFAARRLRGASPPSRCTIAAFLKSRPVTQSTLVISRRFAGVPVERFSMEIMPSPELPQSVWTPAPPATSPRLAPWTPVVPWQMPASVEDVFFPGGPFTEVAEEEKPLIPTPGTQRPRKQTLTRALNRMSRLGTPTRAPHLARPLIGGSKMDAYLLALEAQTFDVGGPGGRGAIGSATHVRRALIRTLKTACRAACRGATRLVLSPWRLLLQVLLRK
ncbi:hypothetical protein EVJ58_g2148 [Rhodofomes roseus]|uniref:Uncharacterized protein n=1 Tax=Rhodofomes roseus TaxID=34475 RepID=A0A4Y9YSH6_9APHY|nr:hypothetical protein EVJ58_g2148 [Rhodofomes roseus]